MGLVLDQRRRQPSARLHRPADCVDVHDAVDGRQRVAAARQLRQSYRRLDVRLPCVRVRCAGRVRDGQRVRPSKIRAAEAECSRSAPRATRDLGVHDDDRHHRSAAACRLVREGSRSARQ